MRVAAAGFALACVVACGPNREALKDELRKELREELIAELRKEAEGKPAPAATVRPGVDDELLAEAEHAAPSRPPTAEAPPSDEAEPMDGDDALPPKEEPPPEDDPPPIRVAQPEAPAERPLDEDFPDLPAAPPPGRTPPARPAPEERPAAPAPGLPSTQPADPLELKDFVLAEDVDRELRAPVRPGKRFRISMAKLYAYAVVKNPGPDTTVAIEWLQAGEVKSRLELKVGHSMSGWRTWSTLKLDPDAGGQWTARIVDRGGHVLNELPFTVR